MNMMLAGEEVLVRQSPMLTVGPMPVSHLTSDTTYSVSQPQARLLVIIICPAAAGML